MALADQLKFHRNQSGFSQADVAEELNISRQSISKWENGHGYPDLDNLVLLSEMYQVSIDELLKENNELKKKILQNEDEIKGKKQMIDLIQEKINGSDQDEGLILLIIAALSAILFPLSFIILPVVIWRNKKTNTLYKLVYIVCICSLLISFSNAYGYLGTYFDWGDTTVEKID